MSLPQESVKLEGFGRLRHLNLVFSHEERLAVTAYGSMVSVESVRTSSTLEKTESFGSVLFGNKRIQLEALV